jgi:hypothetical protein
MIDPDRDPTQTAQLGIWHWLSLLAALFLGAVCGIWIFGIR